MKVVAIIQARMGSTRLPGKVLADINGHAMLRRVVHRTAAATIVDEVVVATTTQSADDAIVNLCRQHGAKYFRGSENDVLDRYYLAACQFRADVIVRVTSDCPLIDPAVIDKTVRSFLDERPDYASNCLVRNYPRGLDTEVVAFSCLETIRSEARQPYQREHVTPFIYENPQRFRILTVTGGENHNQRRWTVDTAEDLEFVREIYARIGDADFSWRDVVGLLEREPDLAAINGHISQKSIYEGLNSGG